jgi:hypothetical protein
MSCEDCVHQIHHRPGSWYAVAEGHDDPYDYWYCRKGHWEGDENDADNCATSETEPAEPFSADTCCPPREYDE